MMRVIYEARENSGNDSDTPTVGTRPKMTAPFGNISPRRNLARGERVLPGIWRLRLPMPGLSVPHCNAWAIARDGGIALVDCGMRASGSVENLERALSQCGLRLEQVNVLVCTHAHLDHCGQAAAVLEASGCELWMHPAYQHRLEMSDDREQALVERLEIGRNGGVPEPALQKWLQERVGEAAPGEKPMTPGRALIDGIELDTDVGRWRVVETPGHAPSHVCLFEPNQTLLISGDHLMGKVSLYFDYGYTPDPAGEFLASLDKVEQLDARLGLSGHGRTFFDLPGAIAANRALVRNQLEATLRGLEPESPRTAFEVMRTLYDGPLTPLNVAWWMNTTLCYLRHQEVNERAHRVAGEPDLWTSMEYAPTVISLRR